MTLLNRSCGGFCVIERFRVGEQAGLLGAYGVRLGSLDQAIALIGPNTGISPSLGLLDATGRALAKTIATSGLSPRNGQVHSIAELETWLNQGPLGLDGAKCFGEGHWFVATGYDQNGI